MSGHSHSSNIAARKGVVDIKRGKLWSKLSRAIMIAAKHGGADPISNLKLRYAIDKARQVSMPKENIERAVKKGIGDSSADTFDEIVYEAYAPGGVAILIDILTDNRHRTNGEIRNIVEKGGGKMAAPGAVSYLFERKGVFIIDAKSTDEETLMGILLEAGADDLQPTGTNFEIVCDPTLFLQVKAALEKANLAASVSELQNIGKTSVDVGIEMGQRIIKLVDSLDDNDDVQNVWCNLNVTDEMVAST